MNKGIVTISSQRDANGRTQTETLVGADIAEVSKAFAKARELRIAAEAEVNNTLTGSAAIIAPTIGNLRERRAELQAELAKLRVTLADDYPTVVSLRAQIKNLDRNIASEISRSTQGNREAYNAAIKRERDMRAELDRLTQKYNTQRSEEHTSELQSLMRTTYAAFCL